MERSPQTRIERPLPPSPPLGGVSEFSVAGLRTLQALTYSPDFPDASASSVILGFRTCLPLRGSSGVTPASLFTLV